MMVEVASAWLFRSPENLAVQATSTIAPGQQQQRMPSDSSRTALSSSE
jgi:hypothetical protein